MATLDLDITGMTCASCANRIERKLNKMDGVSASVNYATEKAHIESTGSSAETGDGSGNGNANLEPQPFIDVVEKLGYKAFWKDPLERGTNQPSNEGANAAGSGSAAAGVPQPEVQQGEGEPSAPSPVSAPSGGEQSANQPTLQELAQQQELTSLRQRLIGAAVLAIPVILLAMIPPLQFTNWQWLSLTLAAPVILWAGWPFHKATWTNLKHGATHP